MAVLNSSAQIRTGTQEKKTAMTIRAFLIGLACVAFIAATTYFNDYVLNQSLMIGNYLPHSAYGIFIILVAVLNPIIGLLYRKLSLRGPELALILGMMLAGCAIPGSGFLRYFTNILMAPHQHKQRVRYLNTENVILRLPANYLAGSPTHFVPDDILNAAAIADVLLGNGDSDGPADLQKWIREMIDGQVLETVRQSGGDGNELKDAVSKALNSILSRRDLFNHEVLTNAALAGQCRDLLRLSVEGNASFAGKGRFTYKGYENRIPNRLAATATKPPRC
jgi:hypothetical protein